MIVQATAAGTFELDVSKDGQSWVNNYGGMSLQANTKTAYQLPMGDYGFIRYRVNTTGTITESSIYQGGFVNG